MNPVINDFKAATARIVSQLKEELKGIRTGRANPGMLEDIIVEAYGGTKMKLMELSTITTEGPAQLVVMPYDQSTTQDIEKAISKSPLGLSPATQSGRIIVRVPPLSEEQRLKMTKFISQIVEEHRVKIRGERDESRRTIKQLFEAKEITEDQKFRFEKDIDAAAQAVTEELQTIKENKDREIMEV